MILEFTILCVFWSAETVITFIYNLCCKIQQYRWKEFLQITENAVLKDPWTGRLKKRHLELMIVGTDFKIFEVFLNR